MKRVLIVRLTALGDIVNSAVAVQLIHKHVKEVKIDWLCEDTNKDLVSSIAGINKVFAISLKKLKRSKSINELFSTVKYLKSLPEYDMVIDLQGLLKSSIVARLISEKTYGFDAKSSRESLSSLFYKNKFHKAYSDNVVERNIFLVSKSLQFHVTKNEIIHKEKIFNPTTESSTPKGHATYRDDKKVILLIIGASWESKRYPLDKFISLIKRRSDCDFLVASGSESEYEDAQYIASKTDAKALKPSAIYELISLIDSVDLVIGNDTGPTHIAWAQNIPSITLFGPTNERMIYKTKKNLFIKSHSSVNINKIDRNDFSIQDIEVKQIESLMERLL